MSVTNFGSCFLRISQRTLLTCSRSCTELNRTVRTRASDVSIPPAPKRPAPAFARFTHDHFKTFSAENPGVPPNRIMQLCTEHYRNLPESERQSYKEAAHFHLEAFKKDYANYLASLTVEQSQALKIQEKARRNQSAARKIRQKKKEMDMPKRPPNSFSLFARNHMKGDTNVAQSMKNSIGPKWSGMSDQEKKPYIDQAKELKTQYEHALWEWELSMFEKGHHSLIRNNTLKTLKSREKEQTPMTEKSKPKSPKTKSKKDDASGGNKPQPWMREE